MPLLQPLVLLVAAIVLLDQHGGPSALPELLLLVVAAELALDQDGRLRHLLVERVLCQGGGGEEGLGRARWMRGLLPTCPSRSAHRLPIKGTSLKLEGGTPHCPRGRFGLPKAARLKRLDFLVGSIPISEPGGFFRGREGVRVGQEKDPPLSRKAPGSQNIKLLPLRSPVGPLHFGCPPLSAAAGMSLPGPSKDGLPGADHSLPFLRRVRRETPFPTRPPHSYRSSSSPTRLPLPSPGVALGPHFPALPSGQSR